MTKISDLVVRLYQKLDKIGKEHEELFDTDVRECMHLSLNHYFVWGNDTSIMPINYAMFSAEGDNLVASAIKEFCTKASKLADESGIPKGQLREDIIQDPNLEIEGGISYDDFIGHADSVLPDKKPNDGYFKPRKYHAECPPTRKAC